jgi:hypothetical protein
MHCYETKIINRSGVVSLQVSRNHVSDLTAIRVARKLCRDSEFPEVWREDVCIYSERPKPIRPVWPIISISGEASP